VVGCFPPERFAPPIFGGPAGITSLFDRDNLDLATLQLHGLTDSLSDEQAGKRGHIGDRSAAGIRLILAYDPERLAAIIVAQDRDMAAERDHDSVTRFRLWHCARDPLREVAHIPRSQFQSAPTIVGVRYRLSGLERLLGALEPTEAGLGHKVGMCEIARGGKLTSCAASALSSRTKATLIVGTPSKATYMSP
jgi:hypothetical protein